MIAAAVIFALVAFYGWLWWWTEHGVRVANDELIDAQREHIAALKESVELDARLITIQQRMLDALGWPLTRENTDDAR